jgi:Zn-dependent metalloprotease
LLFSNLYGVDGSKPDSSKSIKIKSGQTQPEIVSKTVLTPIKSNEHSWATYRGETGDRVEDSYRFLEMHKDIFNLVNPRQELKLSSNSKDEYGEAVKFDQVVNGVKVASEMRFIFKPDGILDCVIGQIDTNARKIDTNPTISEEQAKQIAFNDTPNINNKAEAVRTELIIGRFDGVLRLVWLFGVKSEGAGGSKSLSYIIDAKTGKILEAKSALQF